MGRRVAVAAAIVALTLLNFFQFPGHTYLQADSQIYLPILEHIRDPAALRNDPIVQSPHVSFTLYDELAEGLRTLTGLPFRPLLEGQQLVFRALGIWGLYLIASSAGLPAAASLLATAILSLGATIGGPSVLSFEYEPTPRGFAVPLLFLAMGLMAHSRYLWAAVAGSGAFLLHAPTALPFWAVYFLAALGRTPAHRRKLAGLAALAASAAILWIAAHGSGGAQAASFFSRVEPAQEALQRMRASYNWISIWWPLWIPHYAILYAATLVALARAGKSIPVDLRPFAIGLPLIGVLSPAASYLLLEKMKLGLLPQLQPMRNLLFVTVMAALLSVIAAWLALTRGRMWESALWLALAYLIPVNTRVTQAPSLNRIAVIAALTALALASLWAVQKGWAWAAPVTALAAVAAFFVIPIFGKVVNYPTLHTRPIEELAKWARTATPADAVFLFPDAGQDLYPGVFRAEALRALYVDWKAGGQVNYFKEFGEMWWSRWRDVSGKAFEPADAAHWAGLGVDYLVLKREHEMADRPAVFANAGYAVYAIR